MILIFDNFFFSNNDIILEMKNKILAWPYSVVNVGF